MMESKNPLDIEKCKAEIEFSIESIPEDKKEKDYLSSEIGFLMREKVKNFGSRSEMQSERSLRSLYWKFYSENYKEFKRDFIKISMHPDVTKDDKFELDSRMMSIKSYSVLATFSILGGYFLLYNFVKRRRPKRNFKKLNWVLFGVGVIPPFSLTFIPFVLNNRLDCFCRDTGLLEKYRIRELDKHYDV